MSDKTESELGRKIDALLARITSSGSDDGEDEGTGKGNVPYHRYFEVNQKRKAAEAALADLRSQHEAFVAESNAKTEALRTEAADQVKALALQHQDDLGLVEAGFKDPIGRKVVRELISQLPKEERPKTSAEYVKSILDARSAHLADPEKVAAPNISPALVGYLPAPDATPQKGPTPKPAPKIEGGSRPPRPAGKVDYSKMSLAELRADAQANPGNQSI